jgi:hypothetical protein
MVDSVDDNISNNLEMSEGFEMLRTKGYYYSETGTNNYDSESMTYWDDSKG